MLSLIVIGLNGKPFFLKAEDPKTLDIGALAPAFSLPGVDGKTYTLESFKASKILVIIFTANHCPTAQAYEERVLQLNKEFQSRGVSIVFVSPNNPQAVCLEEIGYSDLGDSFEEMKIRAKDIKLPIPYLYDGDKQEMANAYGPTTTPHVFIFDAKRQLRFCGRIDEMENPYQKATQHDTRNAIVALLEGKAVPVEKTKTFGCSIKWASKVEWRTKLDADWIKKPVDVIEADINVIKEILANKSNKYRLVNLWATWCGPCVIEFPEFVTMQRMYGARDFEFVSISTDGLKKKEKVLEFLKNKNAAVKNYLYSSDDKYPLIEAVDKNWPGALPYTLLIAPGGEIVYAHQGVIDPLAVKKEIMQKIGRFFADD
jgi:thiol-disulfide isomerase/thioredoxin/alkyl hydroperoxide reductase subunit AhpC